MNIVYIGIGSNLGDRWGNIQRAKWLLEGERGKVVVKRTSPLYETEALCRPGQTMPNFVNGVWEVETDLSPEALLQSLEVVEKLLGREGKGEWVSRPIDLDILFYSDQVFESQRLKIPHPESERRWFVLKPLSDLAPDLVHPISKKTIKEILCNFSSTRPM